MTDRDQPTAGVALKPVDQDLIDRIAGQNWRGVESTMFRLTKSQAEILATSLRAPTDAGGAASVLTTCIWDWTRANTLHLGDIDKCRALASHLAALTSAPQVEDHLPAISLDGPSKPGEHRLWLARQLLDSRLTDEEAYSTVRWSPAIKEAAPDPVAQPSEGVREAVEFIRDEAQRGQCVRSGDPYLVLIQERADAILSSVPVQPSDLEAGKLRALEEALTPSGATKAAYHGEFKFPVTVTHFDDEGEPEEATEDIYVPWTTVKEIMGAVSARAALKGTGR